jgi:hypothetical protein
VSEHQLKVDGKQNEPNHRTDGSSQFCHIFNGNNTPRKPMMVQSKALYAHSW